MNWKLKNGVYLVQTKIIIILLQISKQNKTNFTVVYSCLYITNIYKKNNENLFGRLIERTRNLLDKFISSTADKTIGSKNPK